VTIRVVVADDQLLVRTGLTMILNAQPGIEVVGEATDGHEAVAVARELRPDVCLFDIRMPGIDGVEATRQLAGTGVENPLAIVVITTFDLDEYVHGALKAGARGFLLKDAGPELLVQAIQGLDYALMQGVFLVITLTVLVANFVMDLFYGLIDPRVRHNG
jgi:DNA-binding NarL/FixJ family response regulator